MSYYNSYGEQERKLRATERAAAPKACPHCGAAINQNLSEWEKIRYHCGSDRCRKAASRANLAERKRQERNTARAHILRYCEQTLSSEQRGAVMEMCDLLMSYDYTNGHNIAAEVVKVIDASRCKHDKIALLEQNAAIWQRRALSSEQQLAARIQELEAELEVFTSLHNAIHGIATQQLKKQPDPLQPAPEPQREDPDKAQVLATLKRAGIRPVEEALADERDGTELEEDGEDYDGEE